MLIRKKKVTFKEVQSLLDQLAFATCIMSVGRIFSRRLYIAIAGLKSLLAHVRLSHDIREDLIVWLRLLEYFNGRAVWQREFVTDGEFCLQTDSAGSLGFAAIWKTHWYAEPWNPAWKLKGYLKNSVLIELFPILVAIELWGTYFKNRQILFSTDNKGVMYALNCLFSKSPPVIVLLRHLFF